MLMPLQLMAPGETGLIENVTGRPEWIGRMAEIGIRHGNRIQVLAPGSPCLLLVGECRLCLRMDECAQILVRVGQ
jgi:Fe2+ transport system protein FeoA